MSPDGFEDHLLLLYYRDGKAVRTVLEPYTDFEHRLGGEMCKEKFRTTDVQYELSRMQLEYMIRDFDGKMYCYTKPTYINFDIQHDGKICRDPYIMDMVSEVDLNEEYGGNIFEFAASYYITVSESDYLSDFLKTDISRKEYFMNTNDEGKYFYIVGAPFNIANLNLLYILKFQYRRNMNTGYASEPITVIGPDL